MCFGEGGLWQTERRQHMLLPGKPEATPVRKYALTTQA